MFEWPLGTPRAVLETIVIGRERQIFEWIFARKLVKVGFVIVPTVMRPAWVFADRAASEASGETVLNQNESTRVEAPHPRALGCENMRGAAVTARLASYVTRLTRGGGTGTGTGAGAGASVGTGTARAGHITHIDRRAFSTTMGGAPYVPPHRRGSTNAASASNASNASAVKTDKKILHLVRHGRTEMNEYLAANRWDGKSLFYFHTGN